MFDYERFAQVHKSLVYNHREDRHLTLADDIKTLANTYLECGGESFSSDMAPWHTLVAYCYSLHERLRYSMINYVYESIDTAKRGQIMGVRGGGASGGGDGPAEEDKPNKPDDQDDNS